MRMYHVRMAACVVIVASATSLASAVASARTTKSSSSGATLEIGSDQSSLTTFDPYTQGNSLQGQLLYDSLTHIDAEGNATPNVATSWTIKGRNVTLDLKQGLTFSDGSQINSSVVKDDLDYGIKHPDGENLGSTCYGYLGGAKVTTRGRYVVKIRLAAPVPGLMQDFAQCSGFIVEPKYLSTNVMNEGSEPTGPYELDRAETVAGQHYTFVRRANYWNASEFGFKKIVLTFYSSSTALDNAGASGQIALTEQIFDPKDKISGMKMLYSARPDQFRGFYIGDLTGAITPALGNLKVRQAMEYALNRPELDDALYGAGASAVTSSTPFPSFYEGYSKKLADYYTYNIAKAKSLLAQAGYPNGFTVNALVDPPDEQFAQAVAGEESQIGITINISVHSSDFITQMLTGNWPLVTGNFSMNPAEFQTVSAIVGSSAFWNPRHNSNATVNNLLRKIQDSNSTTQTTKLYTQLATYVTQQAEFLNPAFVSSAYAENPKVVDATPVPGTAFPTPYFMQPAK